MRIHKRTFATRVCVLSTTLRKGAAAVAACFAVAPAFANPANPVVVSGTASFNQSGNVLTVTNSNGAIINWDKFSIKAGETTHFAQPSASSAVLNRVLNDPSAIYGTLSSNGRVWLINPAGIMVGAGGRIDTAGFVASTLNVRNEDFLAGRKLFEGATGAADVINRGEIRTPSGGSVYLIGSNVGNEGIIHTPQGETLLAAGTTVSLIDSATPGVKVDITGAEGNTTNLGTITAEAGRVGIAGVIVRNRGVINASSAVSEGGRVFLKASRDAFVDGNGRIVTTGSTGGRVEVLGERAAVMDNAVIDASGESGGGKILVGGDYQGGNPDIANARVTYFGPNASLNVDATKVGAGGTAIVWSDDSTRAYGSISARGGAIGGNGGFVETSGKRFLDVAGARVDTSVANGSVGQWLLDPTDIAIFAGSGTTTGLDAYGGPTAAFAAVYAADINANLATTDVLLSTNSAYGGTGNITMYGGATITHSSGFARTFGLEANGSIDLQYGSTIIGSSGSPLSVALKAPSGSIVAAGAIKTFGGDVVIAAANGVSIGDGEHTTPGSFGINARGDGATGSTQTYDTSVSGGGRVLLDADLDRNGIGTFRMYGGAFVGTTSTAHLLDASGNVGAYGSAKVAVGVIAADVDLNSTAAIRLNYDATATPGAPYGGGDIGFLPTNTSGDIHIGNFATYGGAFTLDNTELSRIFLPGGGSTGCGTGQEGCRLWIGGVGLPNDPLAGPLPATSQNIKLDQADFTINGSSTGIGKRVHITTDSSHDINDLNTAYGAKAGHLSLNGGGGIGGASGPDGVTFIANSVALSSSAISGGIRAASVSGSDLALRRVAANGDVNLKATGGGGVTLIPYFAGQTETTPGHFNLTADGDVRLVKAGQSYTVNGALSSFTETAPSSAAIRAGGTLNIISNTGSVAIEGDQAAMGGLTVQAANGITVIDGGLASAGNMSLSTDGDLVISAVNRGSIVKSNGAMDLQAANLRVYGGSVVNAGAMGSGTVQAFYGSSAVENLSGYGAGVAIKSNTTQTVMVSGGQILLQAGTVDNGAAYGSSIYGGSVGLWSSGQQHIQAASLKLLGGATGHDNSAEIQGFGDQTVTIHGGQLELSGGGGVNGFNNQARIQHGNWYGGVGTGGGAQMISVLYGGSVVLQGGTGTGTLGHFSNECYAVLGEACRGSENSARIENVFGGQTLAFASGGTLTITGGSAGTSNSAGLENQTTSASFQTVTGNPDIILTGGASGGSWLSYGGDSFDNSNDAGIYSEGGGAQSIFANTLQITGGGADVGGAGISNEFTGGSLLVQTQGNLSMVGGSSSAVAPYGGAVYIASEHGGTINLMVGGQLNASSGSGTSAPALIGSIEGLSNVQINAGSIDLTANASFLAVGSKDIAGYGATININSAGHIILSDSSSQPGGKVQIGAYGDAIGPTVVNMNAYGGITIGSVGGVGTEVGVTSPVNAGSMVSVLAGAAGYGGDLVINNSAGISGYGGVTLAAYAAATGGNLTLAGGNINNGGPSGLVKMFGGRNVSVSGTVTSASTMMNAVDIQAGSNLVAMAPVASGYGGNLSLNASTIQGYGGVSLAAHNATGAQGQITQTVGGSIEAGSPGVGNVMMFAGGNASLVGPVHAGGGIDIQAGTNGVAMPSGYGGNLSIGGNLTADAGSGVTLRARRGSVNTGQLIQSTGTVYGMMVNAYGVGGVTLDGSITAATSQLYVEAGDATTMTYGGNLSIGTGSLQGYGGVTLLAVNATGAEGDILQAGGTISQAGMGSVVLRGGRNVSLAGSVSTASGSIDAQAGVNGLVATPSGYGGNLATSGAISGYGGVTLAAHNATGLEGDIIQSGGSITASDSFSGVRIYAGGNASFVGPISSASTMLGAVDIRAGVNGAGAPTLNSYGGNISLNSSVIDGYGGVSLAANNATGTRGNLTQTGGSINALATGANIDIRVGGNATLVGPVHAGGGIDVQTGMNGPAIASGYGGDLSIAGNLTADAGLGVSLLAKGGSNFNGDVSQSVGTIYGATVNIDGLRNVTLNGNLTAASGMLSVSAGDSVTYQYGGNLSIGAGSLQGYGGVELFAVTTSAAQGDITQSGGTIGNAGSGSVVIHGGRNVSLSGAVSSVGIVDVMSGVNGTSLTANSYGGNLTFGGGSSITAGAKADLFAWAGTQAGSGGGTISQAGTINAVGPITMRGDRSVTINGMLVSSTNAVSLRSGHNNTPYYGGNLTFGAASNVAAYGGNLEAQAIGASESAGSILQAGGARMYSAQDLTLAADGNISVNGSLEVPAGMNLNLFAGVDNFVQPASPMQTSAYGGNLSLGSGSVLIGDHVGLFANHGDFPDGTTGHITQAAGGSLTVIEGMLDTSLNAYAAGSVALNGSVVVEAGEPVSLYAGYDFPASSSFANPGQSIQVASLTTTNSDVGLYATGPISANLTNANAIYAEIAGASSGGIAISHTGPATPVSMNFFDSSSNNRSVSFTHRGSALALNGSHAFMTSGGAVLVAAPESALDFNGMAFNAGNIQLAGGTSLNLTGNLPASGSTLGLSSGGTINVNSIVQAANAVFAAPTINVVGGNLTTIGDALFFGSQINIGSGSRVQKVSASNVLFRNATLGTGTLNLAGEVYTSGQIEFNLGSVQGSSGGALYASNPTSSITGIVSGDITLDGAVFDAGDNVDLKLTGPTSTLSLLNGGYLLADRVSMPGSIFLDFPARSSGGLVVDATSGMYIGDTSTPATAANGLHLTYPAGSTTSIPVINDLITSTEKADATSTPTDSSSSPTLVVTSASSTQTTFTLGGTTGGTEGTFGAESTTGGGAATGGGGTTTGGTGGSDGGTSGTGSGGSGGSGTSSENSGNGDQSASNTKDEGKDGGEQDKDKKDDKDKDKDKKSDEAKDEKKNEKPAQKKVAQCS